MNNTAAGDALFVILLRKGRKAAEISAQIQPCPALASSGKALSLGWQMPGTGRSAEISVYLIFFPPFTLDFSLLYVHKTPRLLISALWPLLIGVCERKAALAGEITHTCYFELSCHIQSPCLQELQAPFCEPRLLCFHHYPQDQQEGPRELCPCLWHLKYREVTKRHIVVSPSVWEGERNFRCRKHNLKALMALLSPMPSCSSLPLSALLFSPSPFPPQCKQGGSRCPASISPSQETSSLHGQVSQAKESDWCEDVKYWRKKGLDLPNLVDYAVLGGWGRHILLTRCMLGAGACMFFR